MSNIKLAKPAQGEHVILDAYSGKVLDLAFPTDNVELARSGQDLHIGFADDSSIILPNFYTVYAATPLPGFVVNGVPTSGSQFFDSLAGEFQAHAPVSDTGGRFTLLPHADLMDGTDSLGHIDPTVQENPLAFLLPEPGTAPTLQESPLFEEQTAPLPDAYADNQQGNDSLLGFGSDDALFGGDDDDTLIGAPGDSLADAGADKVYGEHPENVVLYDADQTFFSSDPGIDFLVQKTDDIPDSVDSLLPESNHEADVLVRVNDDMDITNMTDLAHLGLTVENNTLTFSEQWTREGNVFTNVDHTAIVEVNTAENDIQANVVRLTLENNN